MDQNRRAFHQSCACPGRHALAEQPHGPGANPLVMIGGKVDQQCLGGFRPDLAEELESTNPVLRRSAPVRISHFIGKGAVPRVAIPNSKFRDPAQGKARQR